MIFLYSNKKVEQTDCQRACIHYLLTKLNVIIYRNEGNTCWSLKSNIKMKMMGTSQFCEKSKMCPFHVQREWGVVQSLTSIWIAPSYVSRRKRSFRILIPCPISFNFAELELNLSCNRLDVKALVSFNGSLLVIMIILQYCIGIPHM